MAFLELAGVGKSFATPRGRHAVLRDIDLTVERGEFVAILGFSGAGKTTLVNLIAGLTRPDEGVIRLEGRPVGGPGPDRGVVFQSYALLPWLTAYENVALAVDALNTGWTRLRRREETERHLRAVNLAAARDKLPRELSGGMRQRVAVARALAMHPRLLLLDEPLSALDALTRATLQDEIERIRTASRQTVILITNDVDEGLLLADRIIPLSPGPGATLGPSIPVQLPRPRDRRSLAQDPEFKRLRAQVTGHLLEFGSRRRAAAVRHQAPPDLVPQDLDRPGTAGRPWLEAAAPAG